MPHTQGSNCTVEASDPILDALASDPEASRLLDRLSDFRLAPGAAEPSFRVAQHRVVAIFGEDSAGGQFALIEDEAEHNCRVLYVSSEGEAGTIAETISDAISLMITFPYWRDCLKFSGGGQLAEMLRVQPLLERDALTDAPELPRMREQLRSAFSIPAHENHLERLHRLSSPGTSPVVSELGEGWELSGLANTFVVESNPKWRAT